MQLELRVGDSDGIKNSVHSGWGSSGSQWVCKVGFAVFDERFVCVEMAAEAFLGASYYSKAGTSFCLLCPESLTDRSGSSKDRVFHGALLSLVLTYGLSCYGESDSFILWPPRYKSINFFCRPVQENLSTQRSGM